MTKNLVGHRALRIAVGVTLMILALTTGFFFYYGYSRGLSHLEEEIATFREAQASGLAEGLWNYDKNLLQALADGFNVHPYVNYVLISDSTGKIVESGTKTEGISVLSHPLTRMLPNGSPEQIGTLSIQVDSRKFLADTLRQVLSSVAFEVLVLVILSFIVLLLFDRMVTRHLTTIADYIRRFEARPDAPVLRLDKKDRGDELDTLVHSFNTMRQKLESAHQAEIRAAEVLRKSEETNRILIEEAPDAIVMYDYKQKSFLSCNRRACEIFGRGQDRILGRNPLDFYTPLQPDGRSAEKNVEEGTRKVEETGTYFGVRGIRRPDGTDLICELRLTLLPWEGKGLLRASYLDITERVRAEEEIKRALREKEVLLQEVYHRTKNNMQLISAFLNMEAMSQDDARIHDILYSMIRRINSMALVHNKLYQSKDLSRIDLGDYLVDLIQEIQDAYLTDRPEIRIEVQIGPGIVALLDTAIPCGLALNELIVNAVKYAFPGDREGTIRVELSRGEPGTLAFTVADDGVGFPPDFDCRQDGRIGLQTVMALIETQLRGKITFGPGPGVSCSAVFRDNLYSPRV